MKNKFYVELDNGIIRLLKGNCIGEPEVKHTFNLRGVSYRVDISDKYYSMLCSLLSLIMRNKE